MAVRTHTFRGVRYDMDFDPQAASCDHPEGRDRPRIVLVDGLRNNRQTLELLVHESLHACCWPASEREVEETARDIARLLWRLGYRRQR